MVAKDGLFILATGYHRLLLPLGPKALRPIF